MRVDRELIKMRRLEIKKNPLNLGCPIPIEQSCCISKEGWRHEKKVIYLLRQTNSTEDLF